MLCLDRHVCIRRISCAYLVSGEILSPRCIGLKVQGLLLMSCLVDRQ